MPSQPLFRHLFSLGLPAGDFVIAGSGPLLAHGLIDSIGDLDVVARGPAWRLAWLRGEVGPAPIRPARQILFFDGQIQVLDRWFDWNVDTLIEEADIICGLRFLDLPTVLRSKRRLNREKDHRHIRLVEDFLARGQPLG
ncbi:hypothetical protein [Frankia sp. R82]|uniref:hypothetical protein n=1 Tax=Frankia sp. R82 TaxID=2950553 RepID=UPI0020441D9E|nr:hypothetical protein [Frankia sp. R82]MCM3882644.1 hypothetical protein [Frankia sp. R82]